MVTQQQQAGNQGPRRTWVAVLVGLIVMAYGLKILVSGRYTLKSGAVVEDPGRVWISGLLVIAIGGFFATVWFWFRDKDK
jgi:hypothetical protein